VVYFLRPQWAAIFEGLPPRPGISDSQPDQHQKGQGGTGRVGIFNEGFALHDLEIEILLQSWHQHLINSKAWSHKMAGIGCFDWGWRVMGGEEYGPFVT